MFKTFSAASIVLIVVTLLLKEGNSVEQDCPACAFEMAYWLSLELAEVTRCFKATEPIGKDALVSGIDLLQNSTSIMVEDGRLKIRGNTGSTGLSGYAGIPGPIGNTGSTGPTGYFGRKGDTGATGATGMTGIQGIKGLTGLPARRRTKRQASSTSVRSKLATFVINCPALSCYFLTNAEEVDKLKASIELANSDSLQKLDVRFKEVSLLYHSVKAAFDIKLNTVKNDPRYNGATGASGTTGFTGPMGMPGMPGTTGPVGSPGSRGFSGSTGTTGASGSTGSTGTSPPASEIP